MREADASIINLELIDSVDVGNLESCLVAAVRYMFHGGSDERIDSDEFQLQIGSDEWNPFVSRELFNVDGVNHILHDCVSCRGL